MVYDLDALCACICPAEVHAELVAHANTELSCTAAFEGFEPVSRRNTKVLEPARNLQLAKLPSRHRLDTHEPLDALSIREGLSVGALERIDHKQ